MPILSSPPTWLSRTAIALLFAAATAWAGFVTQKALRLVEVESAITQERARAELQLQIVNYKLDVLLRAHGFDPGQLPIELRK